MAYLATVTVGGSTVGVIFQQRTDLPAGALAIGDAVARETAWHGRPPLNGENEALVLRTLRITELAALD